MSEYDLKELRKLMEHNREPEPEYHAPPRKWADDPWTTLALILIAFGIIGLVLLHASEMLVTAIQQVAK